jgi:DNA-binding transcriptional MerR regulator
VAKGPEAFRSISEAAEEQGVPQHVLRFWETKFSFIRPMKRAGGRRFYRPYDIAVLAQVRRLLHDEGYTIKGVQKLHREQGLKRLLTISAPAEEAAEPADEDTLTPPSTADLTPEAQRRLREALEALETAKAQLDRLLGRA